MMHDGTTDFLKMFTGIVTVVAFLWWMESRFGANFALIGLSLLAGTIFVIIGIVLSAYIQKNTIAGIVDYAAKDAMTDRYRMQSIKELAKVGKEDSKANAYKVKTDEELRLLEAKQAMKQLPAPKEDDTFWETADIEVDEDWS
jgi:hypothetical protein